MVARRKASCEFTSTCSTHHGGVPVSDDYITNIDPLKTTVMSQSISKQGPRYRTRLNADMLPFTGVSAPKDGVFRGP